MNRAPSWLQSILVWFNRRAQHHAAADLATRHSLDQRKDIVPPQTPDLRTAEPLS